MSCPTQKTRKLLLEAGSSMSSYRDMYTSDKHPRCQGKVISYRPDCHHFQLSAACCLLLWGIIIQTSIARCKCNSHIPSASFIPHARNGWNKDLHLCLKNYNNYISWMTHQCSVSDSSTTSDNSCFIRIIFFFQFCSFNCSPLLRGGFAALEDKFHLVVWSSLKFRSHAVRSRWSMLCPGFPPIQI